MKRLTMGLAVVLGVMVWAGVSAGESTARGRIAETGWGRFNLEEAGGLVRGFNLAMRDTAYEPASWRPAPGGFAVVHVIATIERLAAAPEE